MNVVCLVDDDADDRYLLREAFEQVTSSIEILEAENGFDFVNLISAKQPSTVSLILLDMNMPKMNGLETIHKIKSMPGWDAVPLVMVTTSGHQAIMQKAIDAGINMFLLKPLTFEHFVSLANNLKIKFLS